MQDNLDPLALAQDEGRALAARLKNWAVDFCKRYLTLALVKVLGSAAAATVLAFVSLPLTAAGICAAVIALLVLYAINATRLLKRKDAELRYAWIGNYRLRQRHLEHQIATDNAIMALMGERSQRHRPFQSVPPELRAAVGHLMWRLHAAEERAEAAEAVKAGTATDAQRRAVARRHRGREHPAPKGPSVEPVKARRAARQGEHAQLEAEIQSLAAPGDVERAMNAEQAKRTARERRDAAMKADQAARERVRRGLRPTAEAPEHTITLGVTANGENDVRSGRGQRTPEQIARDETEDAA